MFIVSWKNIDYNYGSHFDGLIFTAPVKGIYSFLATALVPADEYFAKFQCYINNNEIADSKNKPIEDARHVILHTVLQLNKNDKVQLEGYGTESAICLNQSYFEGRLVYFTE